MRNFYVKTIISGLVLLSVTGSALASPVFRSATGANAAAIQATVDLFRADLGGANNGVGGSFINGRREINWDGVPDAFSAPNLFPPTFFNVNSPRGVVFTAIPDGGSGQTGVDSLFVSANAASGTAVRFGNINATYSTIFQTFSAERLFTASNTKLIEITFFVPGTSIPATVKGFGAVFADVDNGGGPDGTFIHCFRPDGTILISINASSFNNGLSFAGVSFNQGERIARVIISSGNNELDPTNTDGVNGVDVVAMDDFIYGEPRAREFHTADFDGDGVSDYSIFRPSTGAWFVLNSGSNTVTAVGFGLPGDIPVDGDFDGDQRADISVFRPSTGSWFRLNSSNNAFSVTNFGTNGDKPVPGDYDKDGKTDITVFRPSSGDYFSLRSSDGAFSAAHWGQTGDIPIGASPQ